MADIERNISVDLSITDEKPKLVDEEETPPVINFSTIRRYLASRIPSMRPPPYEEVKHLMNPFPALKQLNSLQWNFVLVAFLGWTIDAFDFFSVSVTTPKIAETFDKTVEDITWGITVVLMLRSVGAVIFGLAGDKWGRKWPFIANAALFIVLELGTSFTQNYQQFLACRALFGIAMGGMYGNCAATALEDCPIDAHGVVSGFLQQGYAFGYLLVVCFNRALTYTTPHGWRSLFWFSGSLPVTVILWRVFLPETRAFEHRRAMRGEGLSSSFARQASRALHTHWLMIIYLVLFMAGMNFCSHGSQDLYPTFLTKQHEFSKDRGTVTNVIANLGALSGGITLGHVSQFTGRRLTLAVCFIIGGCLVYPWGFSNSIVGINLSVFFLQFFVQGSWGVVPVYISELAPIHLRSFVVGTTYQLGNLASSASSTIEANIGKRFPLTTAKGEETYNYGKVMCIFVGSVFAYLLLVTFLGPEMHVRHVQVAEIIEEDPKDVMSTHKENVKE